MRTSPHPPGPPSQSAKQRFIATLRPGGVDHGAYLAFGEADAPVNWSAALEDIHVDGTRDHPMDVLTRRSALGHVLDGDRSDDFTVLDLGCSSGHLLADIRASLPDALLIGVDPIADGLVRASATMPDAVFLQASATDLPIASESVDAVVALNVLEHIGDDVTALREMRRILRPGGRAVVVIPSNQSLYDYYDRQLQHERRYDRGALRAKAQSVGFRLVGVHYLGSLMYPGFWAVKKANRRFKRGLVGESAEQSIEQQISRTNDSTVTDYACTAEAWILRRGVRLPFGIRELMVVEAP